MIRTYQDTDIEALLDVWYTASSMAHPFLDKAFMEKEKRNVREIYIPNTKTWVFMDKETLNGFIAMMGNEVGAIFVRPDKQGHGIGKSLMDFVSQYHEELEVEVFKDNKIGRAFYDSYGFEIIKEHQHQETKRQLLRMKFKQVT